jgi:phosphopantothenoylcysteine decarboxylase / phosphopantothenate---cysteine ligase
MMKGKNVLLGVSGGIAIYKVVDLASRLKKAGANVKIVLTESATEFVSPLTFRSITRQSVVTKLFDPASPIEHISLADWSDLVVIAPATANIIGKIAGGIADDLLSTTIMAAKCPIVLAPAMNVNMYENRIVQDNLTKLDKFGYLLIPPATGNLACGYEGKGRLPDPEEILWFIKTYIRHKKDLKGKRILITAGACREYLDPMRFISNQSSGKMGLALARAAFHRGAEVTLIHGVIKESIPYYLDSYPALTADEMFDETIRCASKSDAIIMTAAVTDFKPIQYSDHKLKKEGLFGSGSNSNSITIEFEKTKDILQELGKIKKDQIIVGFAAETENVVDNARKKLKAKNCDYIAANNIRVSGRDDTELTLLSADEEIKLTGDKFAVSHQLLDRIMLSESGYDDRTL